MTLEDLIEQLKADEQELANLVVRKLELRRKIELKQRRYMAQVAITPGGRVYHKPTGLVYGASEHGISILHSMPTTSEIELRDGPDYPRQDDFGDYDLPAIEDIAVAQMWAKANGRTDK